MFVGRTHGQNAQFQKYIQHMKRKDYERPTLRAVKLPQHSQLLTSSPLGKLPDEETPDQQDWD